jgi:hypothetical protein
MPESLVPISRRLPPKTLILSFLNSTYHLHPHLAQPQRYHPFLFPPPPTLPLQGVYEGAYGPFYSPSQASRRASQKQKAGFSTRKLAVFNEAIKPIADLDFQPLISYAIAQKDYSGQFHFPFFFLPFL